MLYFTVVTHSHSQLKSGSIFQSRGFMHVQCAGLLESISSFTEFVHIKDSELTLMVFNPSVPLLSLFISRTVN